MRQGRFDIDKYLQQYYSLSTILVAFKGLMTEKKAGRLLDEMEANLLKSEKSMRPRLLIAGLEMLNNIIVHTSNKMLPQLFIAARKADSIQLITGNTISVQKMDFVRERINMINKNSVKSNPQFSIDEAKKSENKMGLVEIRRKSESPIQAAFFVIDDENVFVEIIATFKTPFNYQ